MALFRTSKDEPGKISLRPAPPHETEGGVQEGESFRPVLVLPATPKTRRDDDGAAKDRKESR